MIVEFAKTYAIEGTAALKPMQTPTTGTATIISFPSHLVGNAHVQDYKAPGGILGTVRNRVLEIVESSEMVCSLMTEDVRGCAFGVFTKRGIAALAVATCLIATAAIAFGA